MSSPPTRWNFFDGRQSLAACFQAYDVYVVGLQPVLSLHNSKARERHRIIQIVEVSWNANNGLECLFL